MSWTYSGDPKASDVDAVRFLVGDTREEEPLIQDEEIEWALSENSGVYFAAAQVAEGIAAYFATQATSVKVGPISEQSNNRAADYRKLAEKLTIRASRKQTLNITVGGTDISYEPISIGMHDNIDGSL